MLGLLQEPRHTFALRTEEIFSQSPASFPAPTPELVEVKASEVHASAVVAEDQAQCLQDVCLAAVFQNSSVSLAVADAFQRRDLDALLELLRQGAAPERAGPAALTLAAIENDLEAMEHLLAILERAGVDANTHSPHGSTPLAVAALEGHHQVVERLVQSLLRSGGDLNAPNSQGFTALAEAAYKGHAQAAAVLIEGLLQSGGDLSPVNEFGFTPLTRAAYMGRWEVVGLIADAIQKSGGDLNVSTPGCGTALNLAAEAANLQAMDHLLRAGAVASEDDLADAARLLGFQGGNPDKAVVRARAMERGLESLALAFSESSGAP
ncbi:ankyrin repeat domain-containing protein [Ottowia thiooxydans]|uniref:Ankyrin repeat protein n=1 Tax=Ottowia thiooxydans TaxID=219182 RepID=A0ABV2Q7S1_9BURK